ncbi:MAG: S-methyl-5'-thioadenosine phosphorylase [Nitrospirae bacterium]|nr:S-methyl-5'-thioadenosine phosphorylase [Nitrospirota bacterium]
MPKVKAQAEHAEIAIIGGSGLYDMEGLERVREVRPATPFGRPSDALIVGTLDGVRVAFLSRHGRGHRLSPSEINYRANIYALKSVGVTRVISVSAVGSMKEAVKPGDVVLPDQFVDQTKRRVSTFFDQGIVAHVAFAEPVCRALATALWKAARAVGASAHHGGTYLCIEGPQFSTRGESLLYRQWGVDVIGMTNLPEAKLAREAELCYATVALVTDYDCWHESEESVTVEMILATLKKNVELAKRLLRASLLVAAEPRTCPCAKALEYAVVTAPDRIPAGTRKRLALLLARHLPPRKGTR